MFAQGNQYKLKEKSVSSIKGNYDLNKLQKSCIVAQMEAFCTPASSFGENGTGFKMKGPT